MRKYKWVILIAILIVVSIVGYNYLYKSHRDISSEEANFSITAAKLTNDFKESEGNANAKYLDKTIALSGNVTAIDTVSNILVIDEVVSATLEEKLDKIIQHNQKITIKGRFIGYDELLEEFKMDQVTIIE